MVSLGDFLESRAVVDGSIQLVTEVVPLFFRQATEEARHIGQHAVLGYVDMLIWALTLDATAVSRQPTPNRADTMPAAMKPTPRVAMIMRL